MLGRAPPAVDRIRSPRGGLADGARGGYLLRMAHAHRLHEGPDLVAAAEATLVAAGEQWTAMRGAVFGVLAEQGPAASAYDIADAISRRQDRRVPANSVYRILDLFVTNNIALRVESANAYVANAHPGCVHDCVFLVCDSCGRTLHVDQDTAGNAVRKTARAAGFAPARTIIEVRGQCARCGGKAERAGGLAAAG